MTNAPLSRSVGSPPKSRVRTAFLVGIIALALQPNSPGQELITTGLLATRLEENILPDAPSSSATYGASVAAPSEHDQSNQRGPGTSFRVAPRYASVIEPEYKAIRLSAGSKLAYGAHEIFSVSFPLGVLVSAGLSHGFDSDPLYGTDKEAFAQRVGASAARQAGQIVFSDVLLAPLLREDPRYYVMGPGRNLFKRISYAATRVLITKTDRGNQTLNLSLLAGYGGSAALTQLYYPVRSRNMETMFSTYGLSLGGRAIGYEIGEFARFLVRGQPR